jgi:hypothetical protein
MYLYNFDILKIGGFVGIIELAVVHVTLKRKLCYHQNFMNRKSRYTSIIFILSLVSKIESTITAFKDTRNLSPHELILWG